MDVHVDSPTFCGSLFVNLRFPSRPTWPTVRSPSRTATQFLPSHLATAHLPQPQCGVDGMNGINGIEIMSAHPVHPVHPVSPDPCRDPEMVRHSSLGIRHSFVLGYFVLRHFPITSDHPVNPVNPVSSPTPSQTFTETHTCGPPHSSRFTVSA